MVGMHALIHRGVVIGDETLIGARCAVLENMEIPGGQVGIGVPPKILSEVSHEQRSAWDWGLKLCQALPACWHKTLRGAQQRE